MFGRRGAAPENKPVCKFWKQGNCRFGKDCKFRHDDDSGRSSNNNANASSGGSSSSNAHNNVLNNFRNNSRPNKNNPYLLDKDAIKADLTPGEEKPQWPLSAYGPGRDAPLQLIEGSKFEVSPEELRVRCYLARATGQFEQYADEERRLSAEAVAEANRIVSQIDQAISYVQEGESREDNRLVQVTKGSGDFVRQSAGFGQPSQVAPLTGLSTFGHTSHANQNQNPAFPTQLGQQGAFAPPQQPSLGGAPSFGQPTAIGTAAFGQPPKPRSSFGQPSQQPPSFGQPSLSQPSQAKPSFGQSSFGQPSQAPPSFGQPSQAPSSFGQPSQAPPPFGQASQTASTFGKPSTSSQSNAFGSNSQSQQQPSPFGGGSVQQQPQNSGFGFGQPSASVNGSTISQQQNGAMGGGFGQQTQQPSQSPFSNPSAAPPKQSQPQNPPPASSAATNGAQPFDGPHGQPLRQDAEGNTVYQNPRTRNPERVWFPNGHPGPEPSAEAPPETYEGPLGDALKSVYQAVWETGRFGDVVPEVPPKREWVSFGV